MNRGSGLIMSIEFILERPGIFALSTSRNWHIFSELSELDLLSPPYMPQEVREPGRHRPLVTCDLVSNLSGPSLQEVTEDYTATHLSTQPVSIQGHLPARPDARPAQLGGRVTENQFCVH